MTSPGNSPEQPKKGFKVTLLQGIIGAASLAGTTAVPILIQRALTPPSPSQNIPTEIKPASMIPGAASPQDLLDTVEQDDEDEDDTRKGKKNRQRD